MRRHRSLDNQINVYASRESEPVVVDSSGDDDTSMGPENAMNNVDSRLNLQQTMRQQFNSSSDGDTPDDTSETPLSDSPSDSKTPMVLRETTLSGQKRPLQTSSAFSRESSADNKRRRRKTIPTPLTTDENEVFEEWCSTWRIVKTDPRIYIKSMDLRNNHPNSYNNYCKARDQAPIIMTQFVSAMKAKGHVTENVQKRGGGVAFYDIAYVDEDCPRHRRNCRSSEDFSRNGQNLSKRLSKDKLDVEAANTHFSTWENEHCLVYDNKTEEWGCKTRPRKTRPIYHEKCAKVWDSYDKFSANLDTKHRFNKSTFQNVMEERGFYRVRSELGDPCGYEGNDWYYTNLKVTGEPL